MTQYDFKYIPDPPKGPHLHNNNKKNTVPRIQRWQCWILKSKKDLVLIFAPKLENVLPVYVYSA